MWPMGGQLATSALLYLTHTLHSNLTASLQIFKHLTTPHLHTCHFSPLLPDLITSFTGWNSIRNVLSKIQSNSLVSSISPTYSLNSYFPKVQGNYIQKATNNSWLPKYAMSFAHICDCTCSFKWKISLLCFLHLNNPLDSRSHSQWLFLHKHFLTWTVNFSSLCVPIAPLAFITSNS